MRTAGTATALQIPRPAPHTRTAIIPQKGCARNPFDSQTCRRAVWKDQTLTYLHFTYTKANGYRDHTFFPMDAPIDAIKWFFAFLKDGRFEGPVTFQPDAPGT